MKASQPAVEDAARVVHLAMADEVDEDELIWKFATKADFEEIKVMLRRAYTAQEGAV